jgi:hypothetical protein
LVVRERGRKEGERDDAWGKRRTMIKRRETREKSSLPFF